ncbi:hypothetical protein TRICI_002546 [Trichomonascus ciferrii]|uniref:Deoxycytidylate deaminase n=1 Tax=Trichomonascus ciferrii TaxID=44093 RepID=A0A642V6I8_9ASCO|nr:hypothetical protein TRICI_002546 [Trichomonascus ciferrii]
MFIGISGTRCSGKSEVARYLQRQGFTRLELAKDGCDHGEDENNGSCNPETVETFVSADEMLEFVTTRWNQNFVTSDICSVEVLEKLSHRPFFLHVNVEAPTVLRWRRYCDKYRGGEALSLDEFVMLSDKLQYNKSDGLAAVCSRAKLSIVNQSENLEMLYIELGKLNLLDGSRLRPSWDAYFMRLANLAALRSNCMKRQVGAVLVRDNRVIATGYNGTPRGLTNCNQGGCKRCNSGNSSGIDLKTCLCLHAEENALLEAGRDRVGHSSSIYCNTCPCLTCAIKIAQSGITEVVYSQSYSMDTATAEIMRSANIKLRQYSPPSEGLIL